MRRLLAASAIGFLIVGGAQARAAYPTQPVSLGMYSGRWFQVGQIVKSNHHPCLGGADDFADRPGGGYTVTITCHEHTLTGPVHRLSLKIAIVPGSGNTRFRMSFLGGLIKQEYWVLDHAPDNSWAVMATPGGHYLWLLSRTPALTGAPRAAAVAAIRSLGYDVSRLTP